MDNESEVVSTQKAEDDSIDAERESLAQLSEKAGLSAAAFVKDLARPDVAFKQQVRDLTKSLNIYKNLYTKQRELLVEGSLNGINQRMLHIGSMIGVEQAIPHDFDIIREFIQAYGADKVNFAKSFPGQTPMLCTDKSGAGKSNYIAGRNPIVKCTHNIL